MTSRSSGTRCPRNKVKRRHERSIISASCRPVCGRRLIKKTRDYNLRGKRLVFTIADNSARNHREVGEPVHHTGSPYNPPSVAFIKGWKCCICACHICGPVTLPLSFEECEFCFYRASTYPVRTSILSIYFFSKYFRVYRIISFLENVPQLSSINLQILFYFSLCYFIIIIILKNN